MHSTSASVNDFKPIIKATLFGVVFAVVFFSVHAHRIIRKTMQLHSVADAVGGVWKNLLFKRFLCTKHAKNETTIIKWEQNAWMNK